MPTPSWIAHALAVAIAAEPVHAITTEPVRATDATVPTAVTATAPAPRADAIAVVVTPPQVRGGGNAALLERLAVQLRQGLTRGRLEAVEPTAPPADPCHAVCLADLRTATGARFLVRTTIDIDDRDYEIRLDLIDLGTGASVATSETLCELCGLSEFGAAIADQSALLRIKVEALTRAPPTLTIRTDPPGALVFLDDNPIGLSPVERVTREGDHRIRARLDGYVDGERELRLVAGVNETLQLPLQRSPRVVRQRRLGRAALGTGVPLAVLGVALLILDDRPVRTHCSGGDLDYDGHCRYVYTTTWSGGLLLAGGAVLTTIGALLLARTREPPTRLRAAVGPGTLTLSGSF